MIPLITSRLAQVPLILVAIYTVTFVLAWLIPGSAVMTDPDKIVSPEVLAAAEKRYNLDDPIVFYFDYLGGVTGVNHIRDRIAGSENPGPALDFGPSFQYEDWTVNDIIAASLPVSMTLGITAIAIALFIGTSAGIAGALRPNSMLDLSTLSIALVGISLPSFVTGTVLLIVFPVFLNIGSVGSWGSPQDIILPAFTLSLPFSAYIARLTRLGMIETLSADYVRTARAKGCSPARIIYKHAFKNAFLPVISYLGPALAFAMTGSFVVEKVFNVPGIGQHFVAAVLNKDLFLIMGVTLVFSTTLVLLNLAVDIAYRFVDPRID
ncbi:MAG: ABC transporter permease [Planctomycetota bacterium]